MKPRKRLSFRDELKKILTTDERKRAIYSFDGLGGMASIEIPSALRKKKKKIAQILLGSNPHITRVYEKVGIHSGKFRVEKIRWLAGEKNTVAEYKEWGCVFQFNPNEAFFNPRLGTERKRITQLIEPHQKVCVFFAGVGPYPILIAKHAKPKKVYAIDWNPRAVKWMKKNTELNRVQEIVHLVFGDVKKIKPLGKCDQVIMPAPETALEYLIAAEKWLPVKGGMIHCYLFVSQDTRDVKIKEMIAPFLKKVKREWKMIYVHKVGDFSAKKKQVCVGLRFFPK